MLPVVLHAHLAPGVPAPLGAAAILILHQVSLLHLVTLSVVLHTHLAPGAPAPLLPVVLHTHLAPSAPAALGDAAGGAPRLQDAGEGVTPAAGIE
jgi:hypothetical protein